MKKIFDKVTLVLSITIVFYLSIIFVSDFSKIDSINLELSYIPIIVSLLILHTIISGYKYHRMLQKLNIPISFLETQKIYLCGFALALTPGGFGTAAIKSKLVKQKFGTPISSTILILYVERWTELIAILIILGISLLFFFVLESFLIFVIGSLIVGIFSILVTNTKTFTSIKKLLMKINYFKKINNSIEKSRNSFVVLSEKNSFLEALFYSIVTKIIHLFTVYSVFLMVGIDLGFFMSGIVYYTSILIGNLSFLPAGIIVTESGMIAMLIKNNIEFSLATLVVVVIRFVGTWSLAIAGTIGYQILARKYSKIDN